MNKKKGQVREIITLSIVVIFLVILLRIITPFFQALTSGTTSADVLTNTLVPLIIFAVFFEIIRRIFQ